MSILFLTIWAAAYAPDPPNQNEPAPIIMNVSQIRKKRIPILRAKPHKIKVENVTPL